MGDRHRRWGGGAVGVAFFEERHSLLASEPAGALQLDLIDLDATVAGLGEAADHQRGWEKPWLRTKILDRAAGAPGLFPDLAPDRSFDRLSRLDESGQR